MTKENERKLNKDIELNKHFNRDRVGSCMSILKEYKDSVASSYYTESGFRKYYYNAIKDKLHKLTDTKEYIMSLGYEDHEASFYIDLRLVKQTYKGLDMELQAFDYLRRVYSLHNLRHATNKEDFNDFVDLVDESNGVSFQVKPISYKLGSNASLVKDRALHKQRHEKLLSDVIFAYYDDRGSFIIEEADKIKLKTLNN